MDGGIEFLEVVHHAAGHLGLVHHLRQHHEHGFEDVAGVGGKFGPTLPVTLEVALHRQIEQPFLVAEQFVQRTLRYAEMLCDIVHAHGFDALRGEHLHRLVDNAFFLGRVMSSVVLFETNITRKLTEPKKFSVFCSFSSRLCPEQAETETNRTIRTRKKSRKEDVSNNKTGKERDCKRWLRQGNKRAAGLQANVPQRQQTEKPTGRKDNRPKSQRAERLMN